MRKDLLKEKLKAARKAIIDAARGLEKEQSKQVSAALRHGRTPQWTVLTSAPHSCVQVADAVTAYFKSHPDATVMVSRLDEAAGNAKVSLSLTIRCAPSSS